VELVVGVEVVERHDRHAGAVSIREHVDASMFLASALHVERLADVRPTFLAALVDATDRFLERRVEQGPSQSASQHLVKPRVLRNLARTPLAFPDQVRDVPRVVQDDGSAGRPADLVAAASGRDASQVVRPEHVQVAGAAPEVGGEAAWILVTLDRLTVVLLEELADERRLARPHAPSHLDDHAAASSMSSSTAIALAG
jgi:hypothetical protein